MYLCADKPDFVLDLDAKPVDAERIKNLKIFD